MIERDFAFFFQMFLQIWKKKSYGQTNRTKTIASQRFLLEPIFLFSKQALKVGPSMITLVVAPSFLHLVTQVFLGSGSSSVSHLQKDVLGRPLKPELGIPAAEFDTYFFTWYLAFLICWWLRHRATVFYHSGFCHERLILGIFTEEMAEPLMTICLSFGRSPGFGHKISIY